MIFYRINTLEGSGGISQVGVKVLGKIPAENGFRALHRAKMSSQETQLILLVAFFLPKIKLSS